jgi:hypothetical protein
MNFIAGENLNGLTSHKARENSILNPSRREQKPRQGNLMGKAKRKDAYLVRERGQTCKEARPPELQKAR